MDLRYTFDPERFYLGTLCKHEHRWPGTNLSLRRNYKSPEGITVNCCLGCNGRKDSDWLISFIDTRAMGLPEGIKPGKPCKGGHLWNGFNMSLRNRNGKCEQCEKERKATPEAKEANKQRLKARYQENIEEERRKARERMRLKVANMSPEELQEYRSACLSDRKQRLRERGRDSRSKALAGFVIPPHLLGHRVTACDLLPFIHSGFCVDKLSIDCVLQQRELWQAIKEIPIRPTIARLVMDEQHRYWSENPDAKKQHYRKWSQKKWWLEYQTRPEIRLYNRQKSKRRKAQIKNQTAHQIKPRLIVLRFAQFDHCCAYCGADGDMQIEHVIPIAKGGTHALGNIVPACQRCNYSKHANEVETWYRAQPFFSELRWRKICRVLGWNRSSVGQLALL